MTIAAEARPTHSTAPAATQGHRAHRIMASYVAWLPAGTPTTEEALTALEREVLTALVEGWQEHVVKASLASIAIERAVLLRTPALPPSELVDRCWRWAFGSRFSDQDWRNRIQSSARQISLSHTA